MIALLWLLVLILAPFYILGAMLRHTTRRMGRNAQGLVQAFRRRR